MRLGARHSGLRSEESSVRLNHVAHNSGVALYITLNRDPPLYVE